MSDQLIPVVTSVIGHQTVQTVDGRALHAFLEVETRFNDWIDRRIEEYGFVESQDFVIDYSNLSNQTGRGGDRRGKDYHCTIGMAKELAMVERTAKGKQARQYFIECERRLLAAPAPHFQPPALSQAILESTLVLDFQGVPIRLLIDESGSWMAAYRDVATALGYINKEQQWSARNMLLYTAKSADRQLRHPLYGDLIALTGIDRIVASLQRNAASDPDRASRAGSFRAWLATVAYPLVANPASAGLLLSQRWTPPAALALERDPDYEQTARVLKLWHQDLGESAYRAADVLASATADFASALAEAASGRWFSAVLSAKRLGKWLAVRQGQAVDGLKIVGGVERNQKIKLWAVRESA